MFDIQYLQLAVTDSQKHLDLPKQRHIFGCVSNDAAIATGYKNWKEEEQLHFELRPIQRFLKNIPYVGDCRRLSA